MEETGSTRIRLVKGWLGIKPVIEVQRRVEYRQDMNLLRVASEWFPARGWDYLGRNHYSQ